MRRIAMMGVLAAASAAGVGLVNATPTARDTGPEPEPRREPQPVGSSGIPDRVSLEEGSPFFFADWRKIGVRINGGESVSVVEFCVSEGWARTHVYHGGRAKMERGKHVTVKRQGTIEPYWRS